MERRLAFAHGRALAYGRIVAFFTIGILVTVVFAFSTSATLEVVLFAAVVLGTVFVVFCASPLVSQHWLLRSRFIVRQGWYFRAVLPFSEVRSVAPAEDLAPHRVPLGVHRPLGRPTLFVTAGRTGLVRIQLTRPRRFLQAFGLPASEIILDVSDPDAFVAAFEERVALFAPVQPDRADADFRD